MQRIRIFDTSARKRERDKAPWKVARCAAAFIIHSRCVLPATRIRAWCRSPAPSEFARGTGAYILPPLPVPRCVGGRTLLPPRRERCLRFAPLLCAAMRRGTRARCSSRWGPSQAHYTRICLGDAGLLLCIEIIARCCVRLHPARSTARWLLGAQITLKAMLGEWNCACCCARLQSSFYSIKS